MCSRFGLNQLIAEAVAVVDVVAVAEMEKGADIAETEKGADIAEAVEKEMEKGADIVEDAEKGVVTIPMKALTDLREENVVEEDGEEAVEKDVEKAEEKVGAKGAEIWVALDKIEDSDEDKISNLSSI